VVPSTKKDQPAKTPSAWPHKEYALWLHKDDEALVNALLSHIDECTGDNGSFKDVTWNAIAEEVEAVQDKGGIKTAQVCKTRLNMV
jgi:hypothetical protein